MKIIQITSATNPRDGLVIVHGLSAAGVLYRLHSWKMGYNWEELLPSAQNTKIGENPKW